VEGEREKWIGEWEERSGIVRKDGDTGGRSNNVLMTYREDEKGHRMKTGGRKKSKRDGGDKVARKVREVETE